MAGQTGNRASITFSNGFTASYRQIGAMREYHAIVEETDLDDSYEQSCAAPLRRCDPFECEIYWDTDWSLVPNTLTPSGTNTYAYDAADGPPLGSNNLVITIVQPPKPTNTTGSKRQFTGVITEVTPPTFTNEGELVATIMIKPQTRAVFFAAT